MQIKELKWIVAIAEERNLTKAAGKLFLSQPALSQCLKRIERELQFPVFVRTNRGIVPTEQGERFLQMAHEVLVSYDRFEKDISFLRKKKQGAVTLALSPSIYHYFSDILLSDMWERVLKINLCSFEVPADKLEEHLLDGSADMIVTYLPLKTANLRYEVLSEDELGIWLRQGSELEIYSTKDQNGQKYLAPEYLASEPFAVTRKGTKSRLHAEALCAKAGFSPKIAVETRNVEMLPIFAQKGVASSFGMCNLYKHEKLFYRIFGETPTVEKMVLTIRSDSTVPDLVFLELARILREKCQQSVQEF